MKSRLKIFLSSGLALLALTSYPALASDYDELDEEDDGYENIYQGHIAQTGMSAETSDYLSSDYEDEEEEDY